MDILTLFCEVNDFFLAYEAYPGRFHRRLLSAFLPPLARVCVCCTRYSPCEKQARLQRMSEQLDIVAGNVIYLGV